MGEMADYYLEQELNKMLFETCARFESHHFKHHAEGVSIETTKITKVIPKGRRRKSPMAEKVVCVKFQNEYSWSKDYAFKTVLDLKEGDLVVCDVTNKGPTLATVSITGEDVPASKATRWIISKVDLEEHQARVVRDAKMKALKQRMDARLKEINDEEVYMQWAMKDAKMATLVAEYNALLKEAR